jgi:hypothetical protein
MLANNAGCGAMCALRIFNAQPRWFIWLRVNALRPSEKRGLSLI